MCVYCVSGTKPDSEPVARPPRSLRVPCGGEAEGISVALHTQVSVSDLNSENWRAGKKGGWEDGIITFLHNTPSSQSPGSQLCPYLEFQVDAGTHSEVSIR